MTFDLTVIPVDRALTYEEAATEIERASGSRLGLAHDPRLDAFIAEIERRYPGISGPGPGDPPCEFDVHRGSIFIGLGWSTVVDMVPVISEIAHRTGLAVWDPQREVVGLPAPFAEGPLGTEGLDAHVDTAQQMLGAVVAGTLTTGGLGPEATQRAVSEQVRTLGGRQFSPLGFEITPDIEEEVFRDPTRYPPSLQTAERKGGLLADLAGASTSPSRHQAITALAAWDPDPEVATALRPLLASEDVFDVGNAALGLARQGDITDLPGVLGAIRRMSPADGGSPSAMLLPLRGALILAEQAGPEIVLGVKRQARTWRGVAAPSRWEREADVELDRILGDRTSGGQ